MTVLVCQWNHPFSSGNLEMAWVRKRLIRQKGSGAIEEQRRLKTLDLGYFEDEQNYLIQAIPKYIQYHLHSCPSSPITLQKTDIEKLVDEAKRLLEEIAADTFLCRIGGLGSNYIRELFRAHLGKKPRKKTENLSALFENHLFMARLISVYTAQDQFYKQKGGLSVQWIRYKENLLSSLSTFFPHSISAYVQRGRILSEKAKNTSKTNRNVILNSIIRPLEYAVLIMNDKRYDEIYNEKKLLIKEIQVFKYPRLIGKVVYAIRSIQYFCKNKKRQATSHQAMP